MANKYTVLFLIFMIVITLGFIHGFSKSNYMNYRSLPELNLSEGGEVLRLVFIGSANCYYSNNKKNHYMVTFIKDKLRSELSNYSIDFFTTGVSFDNSSDTGFNYLKKSGPYDEIIVGGGFLNLGVLNYSRTGYSTPRIIIYKETYDANIVGLNLKSFEESQKLINTYNGFYEIKYLYNIVKNENNSDLLELLDIKKFNKSG